MVALTRKTQKIFGETAGTNQRGVIGSFAAGSPAYSTDPDTIQSLSNYSLGWYGVVVGQNSPAIQDMNSLDFLITRQLAYLFEKGVAEWDAGTTYYIGGIVSDSTGRLFVSLADNNLNNALTDTSKWRLMNGPSVLEINSSSSPYVLTSADIGRTFLVDTSTGAMQFNLPAAIKNFQFEVKDQTGNAGINAITFSRNGSELIERLGANFTANVDFGSWKLLCDGVNWSFVN